MDDQILLIRGVGEEEQLGLCQPVILLSVKEQKVGLMDECDQRTIAGEKRSERKSVTLRRRVGGKIFFPFSPELARGLREAD